MNTMPTSADVGALAGVSRATVSNVINKSKYVSPEVTRRVMRAIRTLKYRPHAVARSLAVRRTYTVGFLVPMISSTFYPAIISGVEKVLDAKGYSLILCDGYDSAAKEARNLQMITEKRVDGLIWVPCSYENVPLVRDLARGGVNVVVVDRKLPNLEFSTVATDNLAAGRAAADYLVKKGYRRIAVVVFSQSHLSGRDRLEGFRKKMRENGLPLDENLVCVAGLPEFETASRQVSRILAGNKKPEAIFACSDLLTLACLQETFAAGLRIPEDIAILGFDDSPWNPFVSPPLTVITQDKEKIGTTAGQLLLKAMRSSRKSAPELIEVGVILVDRKSCTGNGKPRAQALGE
jgi:LacI family transcriptional regulator